MTAAPRTAVTWAVADSRTRATFTARGLGGIPVHGSVAVRWGEVEVDGDGAPVRARAELDLDSLATGIAKRDADLRAPRFLDIDRHPTMTWSCDRFSRAGDGGWTAHGVLGVRGTSAPLTVTGTPEPAEGTAGLRVRGHATLDRRAVGIRAPRFLIGRRVVVELDVQLARP